MSLVDRSTFYVYSSLPLCSSHLCLSSTCTPTLENDDAKYKPESAQGCPYVCFEYVGRLLTSTLSRGTTGRRRIRAKTLRTLRCI